MHSGFIPWLTKHRNHWSKEISITWKFLTYLPTKFTVTYGQKEIRYDWKILHSQGLCIQHLYIQPFLIEKKYPFRGSQ